MFGLQGPALTVGSGPAAATEALLVGYDLIAAGDADAMLIVAADDVGDVVRELWLAADLPLPARGAAAVVLRAGGGPRGIARGRLAAWHRAAVAASGRGEGVQPGWPCLLAAVGAGADPGLAP